MKPTGIIRRIDDLGRIVIPKEIRRQFNINPGDALELFTSWDGVIFKKYKPADNSREILDRLTRIVTEMDEADFPCQAEVLRGIRELDACLKSEEGKK